MWSAGVDEQSKKAISPIGTASIFQTPCKPAVYFYGRLWGALHNSYSIYGIASEYEGIPSAPCGSEDGSDRVVEFGHSLLVGHE